MIRQILILLALFNTVVFAQTAALQGRVLDPSGAVVSGATVRLTAVDGSAQTAASDKAGAYVFASLPVGACVIDASTADMGQQQPVQLTLEPGLQMLDLRLQVNKVDTELSVQDNGNPTVNTDSASNASALVLTGPALDALSDDPDDLQADLQALAGPSAGPNGGAIYIDGFSSGDIPAKSSIREIRINQNPLSAEYDELGYGRIEIFTKPGTDKYHGTVDYNFANDFWNSRNPYSPIKAPFTLHEFEGSASGPLGKRASFTLNAQRNMVDNGSISNGVTLDSTTLAPVPYSSIVVTPQRLTKVSPRVDYQVNANNTISLRYATTEADTPDAGIGSFDLPSRGYHKQYTTQTVQFAETALLGQLVNETRFQYYRNHFQADANSTAPLLHVAGAFNGGGADSPHSLDVADSFELHNNSYSVRGTHTIKFGARLRGTLDRTRSPQNFDGTYTFSGGDLEPLLDSNNQPVMVGSVPQLAPISAIERYRRTLLFQQLGYSPSIIRQLGGGATEFSLSAGQPQLTVSQFDFALFFNDDWRIRPNLTLGLGLRYEGQTNLHDWGDFAPRLSIAWSPGNSKKTVLRAGYGIFYDRFALSNTLNAGRYNGSVQQKYVVTDPDFFPNVPAVSALGSSSVQAVERINPALRAPLLMQTVITLERQLTARTTVALTYSNAHGMRMLRSEDVNAPLPGTYNPGVAGSGVFPLGTAGPVFEMESNGRYEQNQLIANVKTQLNSGTTLFAFYVLNRAMSDTDGVGTFQANPYDRRGEYGPASTDVRHRITAGGSMALPWAVRVSPYVVVQSGAPFNITSGNDLYGTTLFNSRPSFANDPSKPGLIPTSYGLLDPNPSLGERLVPRNFGRGPGLISFNLRIGKAIGFGPAKESEGKAAQGGGAVPVNAVGKHGLKSILGPPATSRRYNLSLSMSIRNLLNHNNPGPIVGDVTSALFAHSNQMAGAPNREGFYETANSRRLEMQMRFTF